MFWAGIAADELVGPWRIPDWVKMNSDAYITFLKSIWNHGIRTEMGKINTFSDFENQNQIATNLVILKIKINSQ